MNIKKIVKIIFTIIILIIVALIAMYFIKSKKYKKSDETADLKEKISQEIYFLDDYLISMANSVNNINLENYIIKAETITGQSSQEDNNSQSESSSKTVGGNQSSSQGQSSDGEASEKGNASSYVLEPSDVLLNERNPDWETLKISVERLYSVWPTITMDLYKLNINTDGVQNFSRDLDELTNSIKIEDKKNTLLNISNLYNCLASFGENVFSNKLNVNMISTKSNILRAYTLIEEQNWEEMKTFIDNAQNDYSSILNDVNDKNKYNVNKADVMLKEFKTSIDTKNQDVLYIKYKNLLDEISIIDI